MLHLSDFSGSDALLSKPTEGCAHASPELPRLPARDAPSAAAYPGGKERVWELEDSERDEG
jgi:early growth response protein 4